MNGARCTCNSVRACTCHKDFNQGWVSDSVKLHAHLLTQVQPPKHLPYDMTLIRKTYEDCIQQQINVIHQLLPTPKTIVNCAALDQFRRTSESGRCRSPAGEVHGHTSDHLTPSSDL